MNQIDETHITFSIPDAAAVGHIVVFLLGTGRYWNTCSSHLSNFGYSAVPTGLCRYNPFRVAGERIPTAWHVRLP